MSTIQKEEAEGVMPDPKEIIEIQLRHSHEKSRFRDGEGVIQ
jgi:hypothetical protein